MIFASIKGVSLLCQLHFRRPAPATQSAVPEIRRDSTEKGQNPRRLHSTQILSFCRPPTQIIASKLLRDISHAADDSDVYGRD